MHRSSSPRSTPTRPRWVRPVGAAVFVVGLLVGQTPVDAGASVAAVATAADKPAISFTGGVLAPVACSSTPNPATLTVPNNTRVVLANFTGAKATVDVGTGTPVAVADGAAVSVKFKKGEYQVRMVPDCPGTLDIQAAVVTVVKDKDVDPEPAAVAPTPAGLLPSSSPADGLTVSRPSPTDSVTANPGALEANHGADAGSGTGGPAMVDAGQEVLAVPPVGDRPDGRGARLLAVIATICVFGVTTAIIRAIVAQRTTRSARTSQHE